MQNLHSFFYLRGNIDLPIILFKNTFVEPYFPFIGWLFFPSSISLIFVLEITINRNQNLCKVPISIIKEQSENPYKRLRRGSRKTLRVGKLLN